MNLFERYIGLAVIRATSLVLVSVLALLLFFGIIEEMEGVGQGDFGILDAFVVAVLAIPGYAFEAFPVSALLGSLLGLGALANHGEIVAMRSAGMSLKGIVLAVAKAGGLLLVAVFLLGELVAPAAEQFAQQYKAEKQSDRITLTSRYGFWARDRDGFVNIRRIFHGGRLEDIYIYELAPSGELELATHADAAEYDEGRWLLRGVRESQLSAQRVVSREIAQTTWESLIDPKLLRIVVLEPSMLPLWGLQEYIRFLHENGQSATGYQVAFWTKIATPFATLVMLFLSVPVVLGSMRTIGMAQRVFVGAFVGAAFYLLTRGFSYVALVYEVEPWLATLLPLLVFTTIGFLLFRRLT